MWSLLLFCENAGVFCSQAQLFQDKEEQAEQHSDDGGKHHAFQLRLAQFEGDAGDSDDQDDCGEQKVLALRIVHLGFDEHAQARCGDHSEEHHADASDDRHRDGANGSADFAEERGSAP